MNQNQGLKKNQRVIVKYLLFLLYLVFSIVVIFFIYRKTAFGFEDIYSLIVKNYILFFFTVVLSFITLVIKVYRWRMVINLFFSIRLSFFYLLNLNSLSLILNSVGLSMFITDGLKSGFLVLREEGIRKEDIRNRLLIFLSPYMDRIIGSVAAVSMFVIFLLKNYIFLLLFIFALFLLLFYFWKDLVYRIVIGGIILSFFSHLIDSLSLYLFLVYVLGVNVKFPDWFLAFIVGSFSALISIFGGLGGRTIGMSFILGENNLKSAFLLDLMYYILQLISAGIGLLTFFIYKIFFSESNNGS